MDGELTPEQREARNWVRSDVDDGIGGPVGDTFRASVLDGPALAQAVIPLERVAWYAEQNDAALTQRLGANPGASAHRRLELLLALGTIAVVLVIVAIIFVLAVA